MKRFSTTLLMLTLATLLGGCAAEVGSDEWCADMKEKPKGDWTMNEAKDFARHCILK
ncbi:DUF3012 domain-containing protein [Parathalassolituus penaei]|uniref:DUF3012 domain-containing protein n=1 Tax=Parathalassolituus penaei TaxID=2997323 RepID=A0A9X3EQ29_9GAMM|nr:DUF3012 domain-containing protein [Parathalassolituus penaei]MCY0966778.1 DUF3012 domain-containing protein [Parathalassolituus penaei]